MNFSGDFGLRHKIIHKAVPRCWHWWRGVVGSAFRLKRSYSTLARLVLWWVTACGQELKIAHPVSI